MAMKDFGLGTMAVLSGDMVGVDRKAFLAIDEIKGLMPLVEEVNEGVQTAQLASGATADPAVARALDATSLRYDSGVRTAWYGLEAAAEQKKMQTKPDTDGAAALLKLREELFPEGLGIIRKSYTEQAGLAARTEKLFTAEVKRVLAEIYVGDGTALGTVVMNWCKIGKQLGQLEKDKALSIEAGKAKRGPAPSVNDARNAWIEIMSIVYKALKVSKAPRKYVDKILKPLEAALEKSEARKDSAKRNAEKEKPDGGGSEPDDKGGDGEGGGSEPAPADETPKNPKKK